MLELARTNNRVDEITEKINNRFVERTEFVKQDRIIRKFCKDEFCTIATYKVEIEPALK